MDTIYASAIAELSVKLSTMAANGVTTSIDKKVDSIKTKKDMEECVINMMKLLIN